MRLASSDRVSRFMIAFSFSPWSTLGLAGVVAFALLVFGLGPSSALFWILLSAAVGPFVLIDAGFYLFYGLRGQNYAHVKREVGRLTLEEVRRRKVQKAR